MDIEELTAQLLKLKERIEMMADGYVDGDEISDDFVKLREILLEFPIELSLDESWPFTI